MRDVSYGLIGRTKGVARGNAVKISASIRQIVNAGPGRPADSVGTSEKARRRPILSNFRIHQNRNGQAAAGNRISTRVTAETGETTRRHACGSAGITFQRPPAEQPLRLPSSPEAQPE